MNDQKKGYSMSEGRYVRIRRPDAEYTFDLDQDNDVLTLAITTPNDSAVRKMDLLSFEDAERRALFRLLDSVFGQDDDE
jgi:hypothetical protein